MFTHSESFNAPAFRKPRPNALRWLQAMLEARRTRRALSRLDARLLDDAGVSIDEARTEADRNVWRSLWDVPPYWLR